jgi:hypothetical protein
MKKIYITLAFISTLFACKKEPDTESQFATRGLISKYSEPRYAPPITPVNTVTTGTLEIKNIGDKCVMIVLKNPTRYIDVSAGTTRYITLEKGDYEYAKLCSLFPNCDFISDFIRYSNSVTIEPKKNVELAVSCK